MHTAPNFVGPSLHINVSVATLGNVCWSYPGVVTSSLILLGEYYRYIFLCIGGKYSFGRNSELRTKDIPLHGKKKALGFSAKDSKHKKK